MAYSAQAIANYFLEKAKENGEPLTPLKLIKLVYLAHGWCLGLFQFPLIKEPIEAWQYGPVISSLYHKVKKFGNDEITEFFDIDSKVEDKKTQELLDKIWDVYGKYSATQLSNLTHEKGSPWDTAWNHQKGYSKYSHEISNRLISDYYSKLAKKSA